MDALSLLLSIGALNGFALALILALVRGNQPATRLLAALIFLLSWRAGIYILGYAGAYDAYPWLTFFPFDLSLAYGPLLWMHVHTLTTGAPPKRWALHFAPAIGQLCYWLACFALPMPLKWDWYVSGHLQIIAPAGAAFVIISCCAYLALAAREALRYRSWLDSAFANRDEARLGGLALVLIAFGFTLVATAGFALVSWFIQPLDYFDRFPLMVVFAILTYALGLLGWRNAGVVFPRPASLSPPPAVEEPAEDAPDDSHDTDDRRSERRRQQAEAFRARLAASDWWRDEAFDLAAFADRLGVSTRTLSRTLSEGLGCTFREVVGRVRVDAVAARLEAGGKDETLLDLALGAGFNSKASFNRAFLAYRGLTPSAFRTKIANRRDQKPPNAQNGED